MSQVPSGSEGSQRRVQVPVADLRREPSHGSGLETQLLFGERVRALEERDGWVEVVAELDGYRGYVYWPLLTDELEDPTHRVSVPEAVAYGGPGFKEPAISVLSLNSLVGVTEVMETPEGEMGRLSAPGEQWIFMDHLCPAASRAADFVAEAMKLEGSPYLWGGRGRGIDCSGLVQAGCIAAGIPCPRDCVPQSSGLGEAVEGAATSPFVGRRRGDLVFWTEGKGRHVVVMVDEYRCLHATIAMPHRKALVQPLAEVAQDQARNGNGPITAVRRIPGYGQ